MKCFFSYGGSRKHNFSPYKTFFLRKTKYRCSQCGVTQTELEYRNWQEMWAKIGSILAVVQEKNDD